MRWMKLWMVLAVIFATGEVLAAGLQVSESEIQYGTIKEGPPVVKKILLTNSGTEKLSIANVATS